jgi:predicted DNA-binding transcriptional regulator AlpA
MKLETYLKFNGINPKEAARQLGCTSAWIYEIISGRHQPGISLGKKIVEWTGGDVRYEDLWR